ncbi:MAG: diguanylate cyclase [Wenzhouxiangella sp.]
MSRLERIDRRAGLARARRRLIGDFHLSLMALFAALLSATLLPFMVYRAFLGQPLAALGNALTVAAILAVFAYSWKTGRTVGARRLIVGLVTSACVVMVVVLGNPPFWAFPTVVANFMISGWRFALGFNIAMVLLISAYSPYFRETAELVTFLASIVMVGLFSMIFATYTHFHRDRLSEMVSRDALTGALNRRLLREDLTEAIDWAARHAQPAALALLDLDNFKQVNDSQGHEVGDQVLIDLTRIVEQQSRKADRFYRLGGEEFVLLLNHTDREGAEIALDKLMGLLRENLRCPNGPVTVSIGLAVLRPGETWSDWLARADLAMYRAKSEGKDRVVFAD